MSPPSPALRAHLERLQALHHTLRRDPTWVATRGANWRTGRAAFYRDPVRVAAWKAKLRAAALARPARLMSPAQRAQLARLHAHHRALWPEIVTLEALLDRYVETEPTTGCWIWRGARTEDGYGRLRKPFGQHRAFSLAHRVVYEASGYVLPADCELHHRCRLRSCVNPDHLEPLTRSVHMRRTTRDRRRPYYEAFYQEDETPSSVRAPEAPDLLPDWTCLCGTTPGQFMAACCEATARA